MNQCLNSFMKQCMVLALVSKQFWYSAPVQPVLSKRTLQNRIWCYTIIVMVFVKVGFIEPSTSADMSDSSSEEEDSESGAEGSKIDDTSKDEISQINAPSITLLNNKCPRAFIQITKLYNMLKLRSRLPRTHYCTVYFLNVLICLNIVY